MAIEPGQVSHHGRESLRILKFAIVTGTSAPLLAVLIFYAVSGVFRDTSKLAMGADAVPTVVMMGIYSAYALLFFGPVAGVLGGIGTWILLRMQQAGAQWRSIVIIGTLLGALCGVLAVPISLELAIAVLHRWNVLRVATPGFEKLVDITNPYVVSGALTGILLGLFVGVRLSLVRL